MVVRRAVRVTEPVKKPTVKQRAADIAASVRARHPGALEKPVTQKMVLMTADYPMKRGAAKRVVTRAPAAIIAELEETCKMYAPGNPTFDLLTEAARALRQLTERRK